MQGKRDIIDDILQSAKKTAAAMIEEAAKESDDSVESLRKELDAQKSAADENARAAADAEYFGKVKLGELEAGKLLLEKKRECVAAVYAEVEKKLESMKDADYLKLMQKLVTASCEDGDEIIAGKTDKRITADWVKKVSKAAGKKLSLSKEKRDINGGVIISNAKFEVDLTFGAIVADLKERTESETAARLGL